MTVATTDYETAIGAVDAELAELEERLGDAALAGKDTTKIKGALQDAAGRRAELDAERAAAERARVRAEQQAKRDGFVALMVRFLRVDAEILRRREGLVKAQAALARAQAAFDEPLRPPLGDGAAPPMTTRIVVRSKLVARAYDDRKALGEDLFARYEALPSVPGVRNDGSGLAPRELVALAKEFDVLANEIESGPA